ncbi:MAG: hypothetical protein WDO12_13670 [Pseudomonadota bacterium]
MARVAEVQFAGGTGRKARDEGTCRHSYTIFDACHAAAPSSFQTCTWTPRHPETLEAFRQFLREEAAASDALYILGDLFEAWIGDDDDEPARRRVVGWLRQLTAAGVPCFISTAIAISCWVRISWAATGLPAACRSGIA